MNIKVIETEHVWNHFFDAIGSPSFHHSWEWGIFQEKLGHPITRLGLYNKNNLEAIALVVKIRSKRGNYLFVPHGPLFRCKTHNLSQSVSADDEQTITLQLQFFRDHLVAIAKKEDFWFIRVAPVFERTPIHTHMFYSLGFHQSPIYVHAETMWVVDISQPEDDILRQMRKNTRYLIKRALREHINISKTNDPSAVELFWKLYQITADREKFTPYSKQYLAKEFQSFSSRKNAIYFFGELSDNLIKDMPSYFDQGGLSKKIAGSIVVFTKSSGYYHQGASIHTPFPVTYLLQWESICEAKLRGCAYYSFHGIFDSHRTPPSWEGLSLFKRGFGGFQVRYLYTQDYPVSPLYYLSYTIDKLLALRRGIF